MSFLSTEQQQEVANLFQTSGLENDNSKYTGGIETQQEQAEKEVSASPTETTTNEEGHAVPYSRFKSVIEARNEYKSKVSNLEKQLADLQNQLTARQQEQPKQQQSYFDEVWNRGTEAEESVDPYTEKLQTIEQKLYQFEVDKAQMELTREIQLAQQKYPNVSSELLLNAVIENPDTNIMAVAEQYNTFVMSVREQAIADYLSQSGQKAPVKTASAPPRINPAGGSLVGKSVTGERSPKTMDEARNALYDFLKQNM